MSPIIAGSWAGEFSGGGGGCGPHISDKIREGTITFMTNRRNNRDARAIDCLHNKLSIKRPKILEGATAATDDRDIASGLLIQAVDCVGKILGGTFTLNRSWAEANLGHGRTALEGREDVVNRRPRSRGNHPNTANLGG